MRLLILGAAGMLGRKVTTEVLRGTRAALPVTEILLHDIVLPTAPNTALPVTVLSGDLTDRRTVSDLTRLEPDVVLHLAAMVSGAAERDFDRSMQVNLDATRALFDAFRARDHVPVVVYASSIAVYGGVLPEVVPDDFVQRPETSYGMQKSACELLLAEYTRRRFLRGIGVRLPGLVVRPGPPNQAISGFFSSIIREPLQRREAVLPVSLDTRSCFMSPRTAARCLLHAIDVANAPSAAGRTLNAPSLAGSVGDLIDALRRVAGDAAAELIRQEPDAAVIRVASSWPRAVETHRTRALGFPADPDLDALIRVHIEDDLRLPGG